MVRMKDTESSPSDFSDWSTISFRHIPHSDFLLRAEALLLLSDSVARFFRLFK